MQNHSIDSHALRHKDNAYTSFSLMCTRFLYQLINDQESDACISDMKTAHALNMEEASSSFYNVNFVCGRCIFSLSLLQHPAEFN